MSVSQGSVSDDQSEPSEIPTEVLISGLNWLGDCIMSMPAIQEFKRQNPTTAITMLAKSWLIPLWRMHRDVDAVVELKEGLVGTVRTAWALRGRSCTRAYILPNSFRSALIPFLAGVPERTGMPGHGRDWMLSHTVLPPGAEDRRHQAFEYLHLMGADDVDEPTARGLVLSDAAVERCRSVLSRALPGFGERKLIGIVPGANYGPAKRWPKDRFGEVARCLVEQHNCLVAVLGSAVEESLCAAVASAAGESAINLAGKTSLCELAGSLSLCDVVVSNDNGGMHLASAMGTNVVSVFGLTDPLKTGPIGEGHRVITAKGVSGARDLSRDSDEARRALESIEAEVVIEATIELLQGTA